MASVPLQRWRRLHNLSGQPIPVVGHPHNEKVFPDARKEPAVFQTVPTASCPVTGNHWKALGSLLFALSLQVFIDTDKIPPSLLFSKLTSPALSVCHRITESQNGRVGRDLCGSSSPTPLPKQDHLQQAAQDLVQAGLDLQRSRLHNLPGQPVPVLRHPQREEVLTRVQTELPML